MQTDIVKMQLHVLGSTRMWLLLFLALTSLSRSTAQTSTTCDACSFDGTDDEECKVYGKIDDQLIAWSKGAEACKESYNIAIDSGADPDVICASGSSFANDLRFGFLQSSSAKLGLGVSEGGFFEQSDTGNQIVLKDTITIGGTNYDCSESSSTCYNAMKPYFETSTGQKEKEQVCDTLYDKQKTDRELEESTLRIRLCQEVRQDASVVASAAAECDPLLAQLVVQLDTFSDKDCSGFGFGPGNTEICSRENGNPESSGSPALAGTGFWNTICTFSVAGIALSVAILEMA